MNTDTTHGQGARTVGRTQLKIHCGPSAFWILNTIHMEQSIENLKEKFPNLMAELGPQGLDRACERELKGVKSDPFGSSVMREKLYQVTPTCSWILGWNLCGLLHPIPHLFCHQVNLGGDLHQCTSGHCCTSQSPKRWHTTVYPR